MFVAIDRNNGLFDKETSDQINVRINNLTNTTKSIGQIKTREHYYDNTGYLDLEYGSGITVVRDSSFKYGKVLVIDLAFKIVSSGIIGRIGNYEMPYDIYVNGCDNEGNVSPIVIKKDGEVKFASLPSLYGECVLYCVIIKAAL